MVQVIIQGISSHAICCVEVSSLREEEAVRRLYADVSAEWDLPTADFLLQTTSGDVLSLHSSNYMEKEDEDEVVMLQVLLPVEGGIDFQHREGGKTGSGGQLSESQAALERKERLRKLALETIDITKDPYFLKNHLGTFECKLCLTLHPNEGNYLAHTQGKRHQYNLGRRAAMEAKNATPKTVVTKEIQPKRSLKIGRPGYKVSLLLFEGTFCGHF